MISNSSVDNKKDAAKVDHFGFVVKGTDELYESLSLSS